METKKPPDTNFWGWTRKITGGYSEIKDDEEAPMLDGNLTVEIRVNIATSTEGKEEMETIHLTSHPTLHNSGGGGNPNLASSWENLRSFIFISTLTGTA